MHNLFVHIENMKKVYGMPTIVALNRYLTDKEEELEFVKQEVEEKGYEFSLVEGWAKGGEGAIDIAEKVVQLADKPTHFNFIYEDNDSIKTKIEKVAKKIYGATGVKYLDEAIQNIEKIEKFGKSNLPICIAKTQYSLSDDDKNLECKEPFEITVRDVAPADPAGHPGTAGDHRVLQGKDLYLHGSGAGGGSAGRHRRVPSAG